MFKTLKDYKRQITISIIGFIVICLFICMINVFAFSKNAYKISTTEVVSSKLPNEFNNFTIAYFSDVHLNNKKDVNRFLTIINDLNQNDFDMVLFGGDLYESKIIEQNKIIKALSSIHTKYGKFAVLGNEDDEASSENISLLNDGGFEVLDNEQRVIYYKKSKIYLYGESTKGNVSINDDGYSLVLSHYPDTFKLNKKTCDLQLSGHTGGGYIYLPFIGSLIKDKNGKLYSHGTYKEKNATLIVSNGISPKSSFPYKLNTKNEVNLITLKKSA